MKGQECGGEEALEVAWGGGGAWGGSPWLGLCPHVCGSAPSPPWGTGLILLPQSDVPLQGEPWWVKEGQGWGCSPAWPWCPVPGLLLPSGLGDAQRCFLIMFESIAGLGCSVTKAKTLHSWQSPGSGCVPSCPGGAVAASFTRYSLWLIAVSHLTCLKGGKRNLSICT